MNRIVVLLHNLVIKNLTKISSYKKICIVGSL